MFRRKRSDTHGCVRIRNLAAVLAAVGWSIVIFSASAVPGSNVPGRFGTLAHFGEYFILAILLFLARDDGDTLGVAVIAIALAAAFGVSDELHQAFVPLRVPDPVDWIVDSAGAIVGVVAFLAARSAVRRFS